MKDARYYCMLSAEGYRTQRLFGVMLRMITAPRCRTNEKPRGIANRVLSSRPVGAGVRNKADWRQGTDQQSERNSQNKFRSYTKEAAAYWA